MSQAQHTPMFWWIWVVAGLCCLLGEVLLPTGFVLVFLGAAALLVGALVGIGSLPELWQQSCAQTLLAVGGLWAFRRGWHPKTKRHLPLKEADLDDWVGQRVEVAEAIPPQGTGQVLFRGTTWMALNKSDIALQAHDTCLVEHLDELTLWVRPIDLANPPKGSKT